MNFNFYIDEENIINLEWDCVGDFDPIQVIEDMENEGIEHIVSSIDGWSYWYDRNSDLVYHINDHHFNRMSELRDMGKAQAYPHENFREYYEGYEWNEGKVWK